MENAVLQKRKPILKIGILSISTLLTAAGAVSGAVPAMVKQFSTHSQSSVQALITIPSIAMMIFVLLSTFFIKILGKRRTVLLGLIVGLIGGITPFFTNNFTLIEIARFLFGAGNGLYSSSTVSLISDLYEGDEQRNLLGIQSAISTLGNSLATFIAGILLGAGWHNAYLVYLVFIPIIILFSIGYNKDVEKSIVATNREKASVESGKKEKKLPLKAFLAIILAFLYFNAIMALSTDSGLAIAQLKLSNSGMLSTGLAIAGIVGGFITMLYGPIYKVLKHYTPVVIMFMGTIGFIGMAYSKNMWMFSIFMVIVSSTSLIFPYIYGAVMEDVPVSSKDFAISIAKVFNNFGAFLSPYTLVLLGKVFNHGDAVSELIIAGILMLVIGIAFLLLAFSRNKDLVNKSDKEEA
ncbi:MFS transporter [Ligilactobacillus sp. WILCCON 0076]|uniref:MFS transporter n=1 Tax=Ligilactobacillus ubinensis TaxID=2876789 RepID=A0A9X2FM88_9LACO|nr:MFS transporter [Ligilactobacillus ubinensis]MCP0887769.1 MFS transporter [Ligilactobacillus ubinensis]